MRNKFTHLKTYQYKRIVDAKLFIDDNFIDTIDINSIALKASFSKFHFLRLFKKVYGSSPHQYIINKRIGHAKLELKRTNKSVSEICLHTGFDSPASFSHLFKKMTTVSPTEYRRIIRANEQILKIKPLSGVPGCFQLI
ncbi:MAG: helix-turn-helix transcriptional regulator [Chitinophagaceae bacterium]|nr:helix-turn-helix transcriptional regulator [Chitinophagaceae bacterium]MCB9047343.1 helix-turn-helix transcriptional regulator [Chitinophagales bacterium]